jgi:hypothetical protein
MFHLDYTNENAVRVTLPLEDKDYAENEEDDNLKAFKIYVLFKLAEVSTSTRITLNDINKLKKDIAGYKANTYAFPSNKSLEGKIKRTLTRQKKKVLNK